MKRFDLDVEAMSREQLVSNYFDAVNMVSELLPADDVVNRIRYYLKLSYGEATILSMLLDGVVHQTYSLYLACRRSNTDTLGAEKMAQVYICHLRKKLAPMSVRIATVQDFGYCMDKESINIIHGLIGGPA